MARESLSTGQAAKLCGVTPDTVLRWVKSGRVPAYRTPGGHCRLHREDLVAFRPDGLRRESRFCWEFNSSQGRIPEDCRNCLVYRARARRCYELVALGKEGGHGKRYCRKTCDSCDYFKMVRGQAPNVLIVSREADLGQEAESGADPIPFNMRVTDSEYALSAVVESFRPDYAIIDCGLGAKRALRIADFLVDDTRVELVRIILAAHPKEFPQDCDRRFFARISRPLRIEKIIACLDELT